MPAVVHSITNFSGNAGDSNSVLAIANRIPQAMIIEHKLEPQNTIAELEASLNNNDEHVLVVSGVQGLKFLAEALKNDKVLELIAEQKLVVSFSAHQPPPDFYLYADKMHVIGLLEEAIKFDEELQKKLGRRLVSMDFVPNTLTRELLESGSALQLWNEKHPNAIIPDSPDGYVAGFLPGNAPDRFGNYKFFSSEDAYKLGLCLGREALNSGKFLVATNGPRMGNFYPESDPKKPVLRRFKVTGEGADQKLEWVKFADLTADEIATKPTYETSPHIKGAPLDPESTEFVRGIKASGLPEDRYRFIDYVEKDSAYIAIACAVYKRNNDSVVYYSAESISPAELALFFKTYAFMVNVMSDLHAAFLNRITLNYHRVATAQFTESGFVTIREIDPVLKQQFMHINPENDAQNIANAIHAELQLLRDVRSAGAGKIMLHDITAQESDGTSSTATQTVADKKSDVAKSHLTLSPT